MGLMIGLPPFDLALLRAESRASAVVTFRSDALRLGESVVAFGFPFARLAFVGRERLDGLLERANMYRRQPARIPYQRTSPARQLRWTSNPTETPMSSSPAPWGLLLSPPFPTKTCYPSTGAARTAIRKPGPAPVARASSRRSTGRRCRCP
jgi:hypothetical protein